MSSSYISLEHSKTHRKSSFQDEPVSFQDYGRSIAESKRNMSLVRSIGRPWRCVFVAAESLLWQQLSPLLSRNLWSPPWSKFQDSCSSFVRLGGTRTFIEGGKPYELFGNGPPGDEEYRKAWEKEMDEETACWTGSDSEDDELRADALKRYYGISDSENESEKQEQTQKTPPDEQQHDDDDDQIDADFSDELRSVWSSSDDEEEKTVWSGSEDDLDEDEPVPARPHERSDRILDQILEFDEKPRLRTLAELLDDGRRGEHLTESPGRAARRAAFEAALKKLRKGPDGRYTNVFDVITDLDVLIHSLEETISGPEYADLRAEGPKRINMEFLRDLQRRLREGSYEFTPELRLRPKSRFVSKKKYLRAMAKQRRRR